MDHTYCKKNILVAELMVDIWNHSMHLNIVCDKKECNCQHYINHCIITAKRTME